MRLKSTPSQRQQMVECGCEANHRNVGHRRLRKASCVGGEMQACGFKVKRTAMFQTSPEVVDLARADWEIVPRVQRRRDRPTTCSR